MIPSGAASLPDPAGDPSGPELPDLRRLRAALRPAELPLSPPRTVAEAADRISDLVHAERLADAWDLARTFRDRPAAPADRGALLLAILHAGVLSGRQRELSRDAAALVSLLHRSGHPGQAAATAAILLDRGLLEAHSDPTAECRPRADGTAGADGADRAGADRAVADGDGRDAPHPPRGRRRGSAVQASPAMRAVVGALSLSLPRGPHAADGATAGSSRDAAPQRAVPRLRRALQLLPEVRSELLADPEPALRLHLAQALEALGDAPGATTAALDVLDLLEQHAAAEPAADGPAPLESRRAVTAAHAVLSRTLLTEQPRHAVHHALEALLSLREVDDPPLRSSLITSLLQALMAVDATRLATVTADRLASLQHTLPRDGLRTAPLLAVTAQRVRAERYEAAWEPLERARSIGRDQRDHRTLMEAARLAASIHERRAAHPEALRELRRLAAEARRLADDLATPAADRPELLRTELSAQAMILRRALDLGQLDTVITAVRAIERRARPDAGLPLPAELLWDHLVDARVGLFIATGDALAREVLGVDASAQEQRRDEALEAIEQVPPGHEPRALSWRAYLEDRGADLLARQGQTEQAHRVAVRARQGWLELGRDQDAARVDRLIAGLTDAR